MVKRGQPGSEGLEWPFMVDGEYIKQFNQRSNDWFTPAGSGDSNGYKMLSWKGAGGSRVFKRAHVVCWATHNGAIPTGLEVDHIDGDKANNNISNLRLVTHKQNIRHAVDRLGAWGFKTLKPHQEELLLALPPTWRCLKHLALRWGMNKYSLANARAAAKARKDPRYLAGL